MPLCSCNLNNSVRRRKIGARKQKFSFHINLLELLIFQSRGFTPLTYPNIPLVVLLYSSVLCFMATEKLLSGSFSVDTTTSHTLKRHKHIRKWVHAALTHSLPLKHSFHYHSYRRKAHTQIYSLCATCTHTHTHSLRDRPHLFKVAISSVFLSKGRICGGMWRALMPVSSL